MELNYTSNLILKNDQIFIFQQMKPNFIERLME